MGALAARGVCVQRHHVRRAGYQAVRERTRSPVIIPMNRGRLQRQRRGNRKNGGRRKTTNAILAKMNADSERELKRRREAAKKQEVNGNGDD